MELTNTFYNLLLQLYKKITNIITASFLSSKYHSALINVIRYFCHEIVHDRFCDMETLCFAFIFLAYL